MKIKSLKGALGIGLTAGLVVSSLAAVFTSPAVAGEMEWTRENTPSWDDMLILPSSDILDYDIGPDGDIIYAVLAVNEAAVEVGDNDDFALVKSTDGGHSWKDITENVQDAVNLPGDWGFDMLIGVAVAPDDDDWLAVFGYSDEGDVPVKVVASKDGGSNFSYAGDVKDTGYGTAMDIVFDIHVSIEESGLHNIALAGINNANAGCIFRIKAGTWLTGSWADTSNTADYDGWMACDAVMAVEFSPNFDIDDTIVALCIDDNLPYMQSGIWENKGDWNGEGGFGSAPQIKSDGDTLLVAPFWRSMGLALPADYDGSDPNKRSVFVYVDALNDTTGLIGGFMSRIDNGSVGLVASPSGNPILASIAVHGDADTGKVMVGEYIRIDSDEYAPISACCCEGVRVWHTKELDFCCPNWEPACKDPSGPYMALVMYTPDGEKAYATTSGTIDWGGMSNTDPFFGTDFYSSLIPCDDDYIIPMSLDWVGSPLDESAFSVSLDDGISFNQIGLIDTDIDWLSDVAICPDCSVIYLSTISDVIENNSLPGAHPSLEGERDIEGSCACDSIWRSYDGGDTWERVFHGGWVDNGGGWRGNDELLLRLPCDEDEECCTVYLAVKNQNNGPMGEVLDQIYYTRDCGQCWNKPPASKIDIQDIAVVSENIVYVINEDGEFSMSTQYGRRWSDAVDTGIDTGHTIISCCNEGDGWIFVGGDDGDPVAWSGDGGETWNTTDDVPEGGEVHIACDPECVGTIYAAVDGVGIFRTTIDDGSWSDLNALPIDYTGIAVARTGGTLYAASDEIGMDYDPVGTWCKDRKPVVPDGADAVFSGVARNLTPCETACCGTEDWDYLICGMGTEPVLNDGTHYEPTEDFDAWTSSIRICGCLSMDTNSILWAIDTDYYDVTGSGGTNDEWGGLWSYEDCAAKHGPNLMSPTDGAVIDCDPCASCDGAPFTLKWERMCNACSYDIQIMDEEGNVIIEWVDEDITGNPPSLYVDESGIQCGNTYTWHVREANTDCECVHSPWSETWEFTIAVGASDALKLLSPGNGDSGINVKNVGFSWTSVVNADSYQFVLSPNSNLSGALVSETMSGTAFNYTGSLDYETVYYWQVKAFKGDVLLTTSSTGVFTTAAAPVPPQDPVVVEVPPAQTIEIPPAQQITPTWIYAVIGIGAALIVVVIVLIVRTRRP